MFVTFWQFVPFYAVFFLIAAIDRVVSTFLSSHTKSKGVVYNRWTFIVLCCNYLFIVFFSIAEFILSAKPINLNVSFFGLILFVIGTLLRKKSIKALGNNWSIYAEIKERHELVTRGIYKFLKHPYYLAVIFELLGVCYIINAFYTLLFVFLFQIPLLLIRIGLEEKMLISYFGDAYQKYRTGKIL